MSRAKSDAFLFLLYRGLRRSEACMLRCQHVDLKRRLMTITGAKTGTIQVTLDDETHELLSDRAEHSDTAVPWVFPTGAGTAIEPDLAFDSRKDVTGGDIAHLLGAHSDVGLTHRPVDPVDASLSLEIL